MKNIENLVYGLSSVFFSLGLGIQSGDTTGGVVLITLGLLGIIWSLARLMSRRM